MTQATGDDRESQFVAQLTECQLPLQLYVRTLLPGDSAATDVAQAANAKIWERREDFQPGTNFKAWAFAIARFEVLNYRKQQSRDSRLVFSDDLQKTIADELLDSCDDLQQRHEALQCCLGKLKPNDRELLLRRYGSGSTLSQYAEEVGRSAGGLKVALHRLRSTLLKCMQRQLRVAEEGA